MCNEELKILVFISEELEKGWKNAPISVKKSVVKILQENIRELYLKSEKKNSENDDVPNPFGSAPV